MKAWKELVLYENIKRMKVVKIWKYENNQYYMKIWNKLVWYQRLKRMNIIWKYGKN